MTDRTFSVGTGNMNAFERMLGVAELLTKFDRIGEVFFVSCRTDPAEQGQAGKEVIYGFLVGQVE